MFVYQKAVAVTKATTLAIIGAEADMNFDVRHGHTCQHPDAKR